MKTQANNRRARLGTAMTAIALAMAAAGASAPAMASPTAAHPSETLNVSKGEGTLIRLSEPMTDIFVSNDAVADVQVKSPTQLYVFGKTEGVTTVYATAKGGRVVWATNVRVAQNLGNINEIMHAALPDANITVTTIGQVALVNGTVASPEDSAQAQALVVGLLNPGKKEGDELDIRPINRLKIATPLQVMLKVRIAEVNRSVLKSMGVNLLSRDGTGGFSFGIGRGNPGTFNSGGPGGTFNISDVGTTLGAAGKLLGLDLLSTLNIAATDGYATILAEPNLTSLSGETASFLAGGEFPIPVSQGNNAVTIEYKSYGVGIAFTPIVLGDGRISMRVRPEVSQLSDAGAVTINNFRVPSLLTRRVETTVELGSGQSMMIAGLLQNTGNNSVDKTPVLGSLPVLGALFRSTKFQRSETELVVIVTPYLVKPVSTQMATPIDGYRNPTDPQREWGGQITRGVSGRLDPTAIPAPSSGPVGAAPAPGFKM